MKIKKDCKQIYLNKIIDYIVFYSKKHADG